MHDYRWQQTVGFERDVGVEQAKDGCPHNIT